MSVRVTAGCVLALAAALASGAQAATLTPNCVDPVEYNCTLADLRGKDFSNLTMPQANFEAARLDGATFRNADLRAANFQVALAPGIDLSGANLESAPAFATYMKDANLQGANLTRANFTRATLEGANLKGANLEGTILVGTRLGGATWTDGRVCAAESIGECK